ncbi:SCO4402 family protein [Vibrio brasiliensis]
MSVIIVDKQLIIDCLNELSDTNYQQRVWIVGSTDEVSGFNDVVAALFDDSLLEDALLKNKVTFTTEADNKLRTLGKLIASQPDNITTNALVSQPKWKDIVKLSGDIYNLIK